MGISVNIPERMTDYIKEPYDNSVREMLVVELYREGNLTLRQAAEMMGIRLDEMFSVLSRRKSYINYGREELDEDIAYARS